jgi:hypothetical protein
MRRDGMQYATRLHTSDHFERQIAYRDGEDETFIVRVESYPPTEESRPGGRTDPVGRAPAESETYERLDRKEVRRRYPELWEKTAYS